MNFVNAPRRTRAELFAGGMWASLGILSKTIGAALLPIGVLWFARPAANSTVVWRKRILACCLAGLGALPGIALALAYNMARTGEFLGSTYTEGIDAFGFSTPVWEGFAYLLASPGKGVLWYSPLALVGILGWWEKRHLGASKALFLWSGLVIGAFAWWAWHGGECWGPRLITPVLPALALGILGISRPTNVLKTVVVLAAAWGIFVSTLGTASHWQAHYDRFPYTTWAEAMSDAEPGASVESLGKHNLDPIHLEWRNSGIPAHRWLLESALSNTKTPPPWEGEVKAAKEIQVTHWATGPDGAIPLVGLLLVVLMGLAGLLFIRPTKMVRSRGPDQN